MLILKDAIVLRAGRTANRWTPEYGISTFNFNEQTKELVFECSMSAAGGGTTEVQLKLGKGSLPEILKEVARMAPENAALFIECAEISRRINIEKIEAERAKAETERDVANLLISEIKEELKEVEEYISDKYLSAPSGEDEIEAMLDQKIQDLMNKLHAHERKSWS